MIQTKNNLIGELKWDVEAQQKVSYSTILTQGLLNPESDTFAKYCNFDGTKQVKRLVVIDSVVFNLYQAQFKQYFTTWNVTPIWKIISGDENTKTLEQVLSVSEAMINAGLLRRSEAVIAIGGGVVLDIVGFAASLYRRGIPYIRVPTTLMGQIDAGIGIKTGINYGYHKNRLGTYFPPVAALIDPIFLKTLNIRHINNGIAEIVKIALIKDYKLFQLLEKESANLVPQIFATLNPTIKEIFYRAINGMLEELEPNLWESVLERCVDYGHTFSPLLELRSDPQLLHGEAVAVDMAFTIAIALNRNLLTEVDARRALDLLIKIGLPIEHKDLTIDLATNALLDSVKHRDGLQRVPLTDGIGNVIFANDITKDELSNAISYIREYINLTKPLFQGKEHYVEAIRS